MAYITHEQYNINIYKIEMEAKRKIAEIEKQRLEHTKDLRLITEENIEIGVKNYNDWSERSISIDEFKKMLSENYQVMVIFCFDKSEFAK